MPKPAAAVKEYLAGLADDRRANLEAVLDVVRKSMPDGYEEGVGFGMICWSIPLARYPKTYNGQPLCYAALASQKRHDALYLTGPYMDDKLRAGLEAAFAKAGKKLDMGKSCLRYRRPEDLELEAVKQAIAALTPDEYIARYEAVRAAPRPRRSK